LDPPQRGRALPHPRDHFFLGSVPAFARDTLQAFLSGWRECGDIVRFRGLRTMCLLAHPDHVRYVLEENLPNYPRSPSVIKKLGLLGAGLLNSDGNLWRRQHRLVSPALHGPHLAAFGRVIAESTAEMLDRWQVAAGRGQALDIASAMSRLNLDIQARLLFGLPNADALAADATVACEYAIAGVMEIAGPPQRLRPAFWRYRRAVRALDAFIYATIAERRRQPIRDLASLLLQSSDAETGQAMSDGQARDELVTLLHGSYKAVANALTWACYLLSKHPDCGRRLRTELAEVLGGRVPTWEDLPRLTYTTMVLREAIRLYPPVWVFARFPLKDDRIGGYHIPAGMAVILSPYVTHRHPGFWPDPEGFDPERFTAVAAAGRHPYAYFPFSAGPRRCTGDAFAMMEMQLVLAMLCQRYRLDLVPGRPIAYRREFVLRPVQGVPMTVSAAAST
jgi:cytochrome P450